MMIDPAAPRAVSLQSRADWIGFLSGFDAIAIVANSTAAEVAKLRDGFPDNTLFVFFNKATRILGSGIFDRPSLLVLRSGRLGPAVVLKNQLVRVGASFAPGALRAVVNMKAIEFETLLPPERFGGYPVAFLDLAADFREKYPRHKSPSSGYALAVWLAELGLEVPITLCGFTSLRNEKWVIFFAHAWPFEHVVLRAMALDRLLHVLPERPGDGEYVRALSAQFPLMPAERLARLTFEVFAERLENTDSLVDRLWSYTRWSRFILNQWRRIHSTFRRHRTGK